ncbi:MAG TPA: S41 family peptidase, partial [Phenylobacterium sp.]|nr:S41 family peptidase [Phenylobacterium sp.]
QQAQASANQPSRETYRMLELFGDVLDIVERQYVTEVDETKLIESAVDGMLTSLDPHSGYLTRQSFDEMRDTTRGEYGGLGIEVTSEDGVVKVISPMDDTPAAKAGIKAGDYITAVNGASVLGMSVNVVREVIKPKSAVARMEGDFGYLRVSAFNERTTEEAERVFTELRAANPRMKGLILDLRNNPGGLLDQAVGLSDLFLEGGEIVSQRGRGARDVERYNARPGDIAQGLPMVVLINTGSASAAEIVAQNRNQIEKPSRQTIGPVIAALAPSGDPMADDILSAWEDRRLVIRKSNGAMFIARPDGGDVALTALDGTPAGTTAKSDVTELKPNAGVRGLIAAALVQFTLTDPDPARRAAALTSIARDPSPATLEPLRAAIPDEPDPALKAQKERLERFLTL